MFERLTENTVKRKREEEKTQKLLWEVYLYTRKAVTLLALRLDPKRK